MARSACAPYAAARLLHAERIVAVGHNPKRLEIAKPFGATDLLDSNEPDAKERIIELIQGRAPHVVEAVDNQESVDLAVNVTRPGGSAGFVGVPHNEGIPLEACFFDQVALRGGPAPVRAHLLKLLFTLEKLRIGPSPVLD